MEYRGIVQIRTVNAGCKSDGRYAHILLDNGRDYILHRRQRLPQDDAFFEPYDAQHVVAEGELDETFGYLRVESIRVAEGKQEKCGEDTPAEEETSENQ